MIIEKLKKEDIVSYKKLIDEAFSGSQEISEYEKYDDKSKSYNILVAKEDNKIIGSVTLYFLDLFTFSFQPTIEIFNVCVLREYRRNNIGKKLLEYVIEYAKKNGYNTIHFTCLEDNVAIHKFYENLGFIKANSRKYQMNV